MDLEPIGGGWFPLKYQLWSPDTLANFELLRDNADKVYPLWSALCVTLQHVTRGKKNRLQQHFSP